MKAFDTGNRAVFADFSEADFGTLRLTLITKRIAIELYLSIKCSTPQNTEPNAPIDQN